MGSSSGIVRQPCGRINLKEVSAMEGLFEILMEQHGNELPLSTALLGLLHDAQNDQALWDGICRAIDEKDPAAASDFLVGVLKAAEFDETFIPLPVILVALHNAMGCTAIGNTLIPCTKYQFEIVKVGDTYTIAFFFEKCDHQRKAEASKNLRSEQNSSKL